MGNEAKQRYSDLIRKGMESTGRDDAEARQAVYDKLRFANEAMLSKKGDAYSAGQSSDIRRSLEDAIADHEKAFALPLLDLADEEESLEEDAPATAANPVAAAPAATPKAPRRRSSAGSYLAIGALAGLLLAAIAGWLMVMTGVLTLAADKAQAARSEIVERELAAAGAPLRDAMTFLDKVRSEVIKRQKQDPAGLTKLAGAKFIPLTVFDPALQRAFPKTLPRGSAITVRADKLSYKILVNWPLCPVAKLLRRDLVDPVRDVGGLACGGFGVWNVPGVKL